MARILCGISGIEFKCEHFPISLTSREYSHPIFHVPQKRLLSYLGKWSEGELTPTDSYLLFLAFLNSTNQVEFRVPAKLTGNTHSIVANNMKDLVRTVSLVSTITHPNFVIPRFVISPETCNLEVIHYWIAAWQNAFDDFCKGYKEARHREDVLELEISIESVLKNPEIKPQIYANAVAKWAALAGNFPTFTVDTVFGKLSLDEYWKMIIRKTVSSESIFSVPKSDIQELIEHCEDNIQHGSIYAHALMSLLREGLQKQDNFLGLGDFNLGESVYRILDAGTSVEDANKLAMIDTAPETEPKLSEYPNKLAYLKAKVKWDMAQKYANKIENQNTTLNVKGIGDL